MTLRVSNTSTTDNVLVCLVPVPATSPVANMDEILSLPGSKSVIVNKSPSTGASKVVSM